jgi:hypothetical protein
VRRMPPLRLSDVQLSAIFSAAQPLAVRDRDAFLQAVAELLQARPDIGDGDVHRAIVTSQRAHQRQEQAMAISNTVI